MDLPKSTFYYRSLPSEERLQRELDLQERIEAIALDYTSDGYRRITARLHREGRIVNHKTVLKIMRRSDLLVRPLRGFVITTDSKHAFPLYPNLYRNRWPSAPNEIWAADITYIRLPLGFCYLAAILDLYSRKVIGWALDEHLEARLAVQALEMALRKRKPPSGLIHHSDRGVQYACHDYTELLKQHGCQISMSRKGNPYDNAAMESFMKTLKKEEVYQNEYRTLEEARHKIAHFLNHIYNQTRLHSRLGYVPPEQYELQYKQPLPAA